MSDDERTDPIDDEIRESGDAAERCMMIAKSQSWGGSGVEKTRIKSEENQSMAFENAGALAPPADPYIVEFWIRSSAHLNPNIDAYVANIESFGHRYEPVVDLKDDDQLAEEVYLERLRLKAEPGAKLDPKVKAWAPDPWPTESELPVERDNLQINMRKEKAKLTRFFAGAAGDISFTTLRRRNRKDLEGHGYSFWEVLRNESTRELCEFNLLPVMSMRIMPQDEHFTTSKELRRVTALGFETTEVQRRYRRYVQVVANSNELVYFKELGDPRTISSKDGQCYAKSHARDKAGNLIDRYAMDHTGKNLLKVLPDDHLPAVEAIHWKIYSSQSIYGLPRWWATHLDIAGSREASELNYRYFKQNMVPPLALLLEGASLDPNFAKEFARTVSSTATGTKGAHRLLTIQLQGNPGAPAQNQPRAKFVPLRAAQQDDGLFLKYCQRADDVVSMQFRQPRILRGDSEGHNRANAEAALDMTEAQVYQPEREEFDEFINRRILPDLGILYWRFVTNATKTRDPDGTRKDIELGAKFGALIPGDIRDMIAAKLDVELAEIDEPWMHQPLAITESLIQHGEFPPRLPLPQLAAPPADDDSDPPLENPLAAEEQPTAAELSRFKAVGDSDDDFAEIAGLPGIEIEALEGIE